jgi:hypothetical protein
MTPPVPAARRPGPRTRLPGAWSGAAEQLADGQQLTARAGAAGPEPPAGTGAAATPLLAEVAGLTARALIDGSLAARPGRWHRVRPGAGSGGPAPPGSLAAGTGAVAAAARRRERGAADGAAAHLVVTVIVTRREHSGSVPAPVTAARTRHPASPPPGCAGPSSPRCGRSPRVRPARLATTRDRNLATDIVEGQVLPQTPATRTDGNLTKRISHSKMTQRTQGGGP